MLYKLSHCANSFTAHFNLNLPRHASLYPKLQARASARGGEGHRAKYRALGLPMCNHSLYTIAAERAGHPEQVDRLQHTGFSATIASKKNIYLPQIIQPYLLQVSHMIYL